MVSRLLSSRQGLPERHLFSLLLMILVVAPLPLGSAREWAWPVLSALVFLLSAAYLHQLLGQKKSVSSALYRARWVITILLAIISWQLLQLLPLPFAVVKALSPVSAELHAAAYDTPPLFIPLSLDTYSTWLGFLKSLTYLLLFVLVLALANSRRRVKWLLYVVLYSGLFQACYGSFMALMQMENGLFMQNRQFMNATGSFMNRNHFAGFLEICLALGIGLLMSQLSRVRSANWKQRTRKVVVALLGEKARVRLALVIMVVALVLSHSRMGNSAFFSSMLMSGCGALFILWWRARNQGQHDDGGQRPVMLLLVSLVVIDIFIVGAWFGVDRVVERLETTSMQSETRDEVNEYALKIVADFPLAGVGSGAFYSVISAYQDERVGVFYDQAHNDYLQFAVELGLPAAIGLGVIVFLCLRAALMAMWHRRSRFYFAVAFAGFMATLSILIHSFVDFNLQIPANAIYFMVALALGFIAQSLETGRRCNSEVAPTSIKEELR